MADTGPESPRPDSLRPDPLRKVGHDKARAAAARKRAEAEALGLDAAAIAALVDRFYEGIRADPELGPIFTARIAEWPPHLQRMNQFWRSILHGSGEFTGNPMRKHVALPRLGAGHFVRWLDLFYATVRRLGAERDWTQATQAVVAGRARMIADSLLTGIDLHHDGLTGARAGSSLPQFEP